MEYASPEKGRTYQEIQRDALRELLELSAEGVQPGQQQIEERWVRQKDTAQRDLQNTLKRIAHRRRALQREIRQDREGQVQRIRSRFEGESRPFEADTQAERDRIADEVEAAEVEAKNELDHELWVAETVSEATKEGLRKEFRRIRKRVSGLQARVAALDDQARWLMERYRQRRAPAVEPTEVEESISEEALIAFRREHETAQRRLSELADLGVAQLFVGYRPHVYVVLVCAGAVGLTGLLALKGIPNGCPFRVSGPLVGLVAMAVSLAAGHALRRVARSRVLAVYVPLREALDAAGRALGWYVEWAKKERGEREAQAIVKRERRVQSAQEHFDLTVTESRRRRAEATRRLEESYSTRRRQLAECRDGDLRQVEESRRQSEAAVRQRYERYLRLARERYEQRIEASRSEYDSSLAALHDRWDRGLSCIEEFLSETARLKHCLSGDWPEANGLASPTPDERAVLPRFGEFRVDLGRLADVVRGRAAFDIDRSRRIAVPALLSFPDRCSLLLQTDQSGRSPAMEALRAVMLRLLTSLPPGRVHFTVIDPIGLGEPFAGFMHLADYDESLIGGRIWTEAAHVEQRLTDLTNHMENVIQKYLRNEFATIEQYNQQAGELAEPYRFLVVADFPTNFSETAIRRLGSIVTSGARCGVYALICHDTRQSLPGSMALADLQAACIHLTHQDGEFVWQDDVFGHFALRLDRPPSEERMTEIMRNVGSRAIAAKRVEVPFDSVAPPADRQWTDDSKEDLRVPIGRCGATRLQYLRLGRGVAQHGLIAGKTGSGKSTLLHVIITNLALWYPPDQVEFYLVDFKEGVEFKSYVANDLAHARAVAIESDREFGLSVLQRLDREMAHRGELFRSARVQDLTSYRQKTGNTLPRTLLIVDEFQTFFTEDDKLSQDAAILLDRLVRQGRAFGIHVLLGSQTLGGTSGLARSTMGQMAVRIALQCSEADAQLILDDDNVAPRLLSRPGEAIYNDASGLVAGNNPFQTAWLPDRRRDECLAQVAELARQRCPEREPMIVFEGNAPADIRKNRPLAALLDRDCWPAVSGPPRIWLGEPVAIKDPTSVAFRRQSGSNLLLVGQRDEAAMGIMTAALVCLAAQRSPEAVRFFILDGSPPDSSHADLLGQIADMLPHTVRMVSFRQVAETIAELAREMQARLETSLPPVADIYVLIYGLQRYRVVRRQEEDFALSTLEAEAPASADKQFAELLREGPALGMHTLAWLDTPAALDRTLDRQARGEFDGRVLFQMSATDSSNLIDSPVASDLGFYRALLYSEELARLEKFRPYARPDYEWLRQVGTRLAARTRAPGSSSNSS
ncbi:MAG TPA: FtsK/SpoIIIE domain-containing protein [Phycisphaerae bacterium]|nr:FtsK/SpoIIIE domain-containing protein [Phycisphaerae bacterium]